LRNTAAPINKSLEGIISQKREIKNQKNNLSFSGKEITFANL
jgi:hypothetical protein